MEQENVKLRCGQCGQEFLVPKPTDMKPHTVSCPSCENKIQVKLNHVAIRLKPTAPKQKPVSPRQEPVKEYGRIGTLMAAPARKHIYVYRDHAELGLTYTIECPECGFRETVKVESEGNHKWVCKQCKAIIGYKAVKPKQRDRVTHTFSSRQMNRDTGELVWGGMLRSKREKLPADSCVTIGRNDADMPSDISVNDQYMSRQSAKIETIRTDKGYTFKFTVMNASNPVFVNGCQLQCGNSIYLNYGDTIILGKTRFTFRKSKK